MNRVLALDIGNVCVKIDHSRCFKQLGFENAPPWFIEVLRKFECGQCSENDFFQQFHKNLTDIAYSNDQLLDIFNSTLIKPVPGMVELVSSLAHRGVKVVFFSDISTIHLQNVRKKFPPAVNIEGVYSFEAGAQKPDEQMFATFEHRYGTPCLYTDDRQELITAARKRAWPSEVFTSAAELEKQLFKGCY